MEIRDLARFKYAVEQNNRELAAELLAEVESYPHYTTAQALQQEGLCIGEPLSRTGFSNLFRATDIKTGAPLVVKYGRDGTDLENELQACAELKLGL